jgi:hypothetical protein
MEVHRGFDNRVVPFGTLLGGERFIGSVTNRKFIKLASSSCSGKNCAVIETGELRKVSADELVERIGALKQPFSTLNVGDLFRGTKTKAVFQKINNSGERGNVVRVSNGSTQFRYCGSAMVEKLTGVLGVVGR